MLRLKYKKFVTGIVASAMLGFSLIPSLNTLGGTTAESTSAINLRQTPEWKGTIITVVEPGDVLTVLGNDGSGWVKVSFNGSVGYVPESYLEMKVETTSTTTQNSESEGDFYLSETTQVYVTSDDAIEGVNPIKTYAAGNYYIFKSVNGVYNISKTEGAPGGWINPNGVTNETTKATTKATTAATKATTTISGNKFTLSSSTPVYVTASDASSKTSSTGYYGAGTYYIYKTALGMYNISKTEGVPGAWVNPGSVSTPVVTTTARTTSPVTTVKTTTAITSAPRTNSTTVGGSYYISSTVYKYMTANDAKLKQNSIGTLASGQYYVYKVADGMVNISKTPSVPGAWINPGTQVSTTTPKTTAATTTAKTTTANTTTPKTTTATNNVVVSGSQITIKASVPSYIMASDALNKTNPIGNVSAGTYYLYKSFSGMLNVTKVPGIPGAWINPGTTTTQVTTPTKTTTATNTTKPQANGYVNYSLDLNNKIIGQGTYLKSGPGSGSNLTYLEYGTLVKPLGTSGIYTKVQYLGTSMVGYVKTNILEVLPKMASPITPTRSKKLVIGLDPGHGGPDSGATGTYNGFTYTERDLNFQIAFKTKAALEALGFDVVLSQTNVNNDDYIYNKAQVFNQGEVDYAISIHNNWAPGASGSLVLYSEEKNNKKANVNLAESKQLGQMISNQLAGVTGSSENIGDVTFYGDGPLRINASADAPSALLELGYMNSYSDMSILTSPTGQVKLANAIARGVLNAVNN